MDKLNYTSFAKACIDELTIRQEKLHEVYDLNWYDQWFYDQVTGLLTLTTGDVQLNFKYIPVGSFALNAGTWKWAWDNETTLHNEQTKSIKAFGEKHHFPKLTNGYFPSKEMEAWEFAAIGNNLMDGLGIYRPVIDGQLQFFLVLTEFVPAETAQKIKDQFIQCDTHGTNRPAYVCQHLIGNTMAGFYEAFTTTEHMKLGKDQDFQAWCTECEAVRQREGEWNDYSMPFANIKLVCEQCYFKFKKLNGEGK